MRRAERARRRYRRLLWLWPQEHRDHYGSEMEDAFLTLLRMDRERRGGLGALGCWLGAARDALIGGITQRWRIRSRRRTQLGGSFNRRSGGETMGTIAADIRYAVRVLARRPVFALTAILTIMIGIGANAAMFTVVNGFMFRPLPYENPDELIAIWAANPSLGWSGTDVDHADAWDWRERAATLQDLTVFDNAGFNLTGGDTPELVDGLRVTPNFLSVFGLQPALGRDFMPDEIGEGRDDVVIITDGFWERRFARSRDALGATLTLDGEQVTIVGIMAPDFLFHRSRPDVIRPWPFEMATARRANHSADAVGRMADGVSIDAAREDLAAVARQLEAEHPENEGWTVDVRPLKEDVVGEVASQASIVLMGAVGFILLMACVNVANLLLARAGGRAREIGVRIALGARRSRIVRQLLTESIVIAAVGGALGLAAAEWGYRAIVAALPQDLPPVFQFEMNGTVLAFTVAITVAAALTSGVLPAMRATAPDRHGRLRSGGRTGTTKRAGRLGGALVVVQTALALVLLVGGGLLMKSLVGMRTQDFGFDPEHVLTARVSLPQAQYDSQEASDAYWSDVTARLRTIPGVIAAGTTQSHPLMGSNWGQTLRIAGQETSEDELRTARLTLASPGLFEALRFRMVKGRVFMDSDALDAPKVAIVNEAFVDRYLGPSDDPLEQTLLSGDDWSVSIVGVVHDVVERSVDRPPEPSLYLPIAQYDNRSRSLVLRTAGDPREVVPALQDAVWAVDGDIPISRIQTMVDLVDDRVGGFAVIGNLMAVFAVLSLLLGAVGIYGVTSHAAGQRTSEIGLRLAMGAERSDVVRMVVRQGAVRTSLGLAIGLALSFALGGAMSGILTGVSPRDPATFAMVTLLLVSVSFFGLYIPARRAAKVDPVKALAAE